MRYGAMNFPVKPVLEEIEALAVMGFDYVELSMDPPQAHYSQILHHQKEIRRRLQALHLGLVCHLPTFVSTADLTESIRYASRFEVLHSLEAAHVLRAEKIVLHPSIISGLGPYVIELALEYARESLDMIIAKAAELDLVLCLENMFPRYRSFIEAADFTSVLKAYPDLKIPLDVGHANIGNPGGKRIFEFIGTHGDRIGHLHVSDNRGRTDDHLPIGDGNINWRDVTQALRACRYDDTVTLEVFAENRQLLQKSLLKIKALF